MRDSQGGKARQKLQAIKPTCELLCSLAERILNEQKLPAQQQELQPTYMLPN